MPTDKIPAQKELDKANEVVMKKMADEVLQSMPPKIVRKEPPKKIAVFNILKLCGKLLWKTIILFLIGGGIFFWYESITAVLNIRAHYNF